MKNIYEVKSVNKVKSAFIVAFFAIFVFIAIYILTQAMGIYMGYEPGGLGLVGIAFIISGLTSYLSYWYSDKIVLTISSARPANRRKDFLFYTVAENLAIGSGIPKPKLFLIEDTALNAFATGRDPEHAVICVTTGLLEKLNRSELEGVIGHELSHITNYDTRLMSVVTVMVGVVALLADWFIRMSFHGRSENNEKDGFQAVIMILGIIFALISPIIAQLIQLAISRRREFTADAGSVSLTRQPQGLINALTKISKDREPLEVANKATAHLYINNPFKIKSKSTVGLFSGLFNTHPPIEERIAALKQMS